MNARTGPILVFTGLLLVWGYSWVLLKLALLDAGPINFAAQRTFIGAMALLVMLPLMRRPFWPTRVRETFLLGIVQTTIFVTLSQLSLVDGGAGRSAVLVFTMPFWTLLFAAFALDEQVGIAQRWAVALAAVGLVIMLEPWQLGGSVKSKMIAISAGATWAASAVMVKRIQQRESMDAISLTAWQMFFGSSILMLIALFVDEPATNWNPRFGAILLFTALIPTGLGWLVWVYLLQRLSAGVASMSMLAIPVLATASSAIQLGERLKPNEYAGMALIVGALVVLSRAAMRPHKANE